jgi:putative toxin-antitoxin system antitoxin component (TIGR02293 family)
MLESQRQRRCATQKLAQQIPRFAAENAGHLDDAREVQPGMSVDRGDICRYNGRQMVNELRAVVKELGGRTVLGRSLNSQHDLCEAIRTGFPPAVVEQLMQASGLTLKELADALDLSPRSLQRRRRSGRLARFESDRLYRLARIVALAQRSLGDRPSAARWLKRSNRALGGAAPISAMDTELGAREVENVLGRIAYGGVS